MGAFIDYMSLPQNDKLNPELQRSRSVAEEALFKEALSAMEQVYSVGATPVIVLPMDGAVDEGREYISRGWCFLEFCLALSFGNVANAHIHPPVQHLVDGVKARRGDTVEGFRSAFALTHFTNKGDAGVVLGLFENTLCKRGRQP